MTEKETEQWNRQHKDHRVEGQVAPQAPAHTTVGRVAEPAWWLGEEPPALACRRCGEGHPACLALYPESAIRSGGRLVSDLLMDGCDAEAIVAEAVGRTVLCKNCHRKEQWARRASSAG